MGDYDAFLRAVLADPSDDLPRMIFADWLDEHGEDGQALMIRRGIRDGAGWRADNMSRLIPNGHGASRHLIGKWMRRNLGHPPRGFISHVRLRLPPPAAGRWCALHFRRGFVALTECDWEWWVSCHAALLESCPLRQRNVGTEAEPRWVAGTGGLVRLTTLPEIMLVPYDGSGPMATIAGLAFRYQPSSAEVREDMARAILAAEFPGVEFALPTAVPDPRPAARPRRLFVG